MLKNCLKKLMSSLLTIETSDAINLDEFGFTHLIDWSYTF